MAAPVQITARERLVRWQPRFVLCAVCRSPTHGFGWQEPQRMIKPRPQDGRRPSTVLRRTQYHDRIRRRIA